MNSIKTSVIIGVITIVLLGVVIYFLTGTKKDAKKESETPATTPTAQ